MKHLLKGINVPNKITIKSIKSIKSSYLTFYKIVINPITSIKPPNKCQLRYFFSPFCEEELL